MIQTHLSKLTYTLESKEKLIKGRVGYYSSYVNGDARINVYTEQPEELKETLKVGDYELECIGINNKVKHFYLNAEGVNMTITKPNKLPVETITMDDLKDKKYEISINYFVGVDNSIKNI